MDHHELVRTQGVVLGQRAHRPPGDVHVAQGLGHHESRRPRTYPGLRHGGARLVDGEFHAGALREFGHDHDTDVVPGPRVAVPRVAQSHDQRPLRHLVSLLPCGAPLVRPAPYRVSDCSLPSPCPDPGTTAAAGTRGACRRSSHRLNPLRTGDHLDHSSSEDSSADSCAVSPSTSSVSGSSPRSCSTGSDTLMTSSSGSDTSVTPEGRVTSAA